MSKFKWQVQVPADVDVDVSDVFDQLRPEDVLAHISAEELLHAMKDETIIDHLEQFGYEVRKVSNG